MRTTWNFGLLLRGVLMWERIGSKQEFIESHEIFSDI
jgi:hypothetical protein